MLQARFVSSFCVEVPGLIKNDTAAARSTEFVRAMLSAVMGPNATVAANITGFPYGGYVTADVDAILPSSALPAVIQSSCCQQYSRAFEQVAGNPGENSLFWILSEESIYNPGIMSG